MLKIRNCARYFHELLSLMIFILKEKNSDRCIEFNYKHEKKKKETSEESEDFRRFRSIFVYCK